MVLAGGVIILVGIVFTLVLVWVLNAVLAGQFREIAVPMFLEVPLIGPTDCAPPPVDAPPPAYDFGVPGMNEPGCFHQMIVVAGVFILAISIIVVMLIAMFRNVNAPAAVIKQWFGFIGVGVLSLFLIAFFQPIHDMAAVAVSNIAINFAAFPHQPPPGDVAAARAGAEESIMFPLYAMRDFGVANHECFEYIDIDGDGFADSVEPDIGCITINVFSGGMHQAVLIGTIGSYVSLISMLLMFIVAIMRYMLTGFLAVFFPIIFALSRIPAINGLPKMLVETYVGLMIVPIIIGGFAAIGPMFIAHVLNDLYARGTDESAVHYAAFIMFVGLVFTQIALMLAAGRIVSHAALMMTGTIMTAVNQMGHAASRLGTGLAKVGLGRTMGGGLAAGGGMGAQMFGWGGGAGGMGSDFEGGHSVNADRTSARFNPDDFGPGFYGGGGGSNSSTLPQPSGGRGDR